MKLRTSKNRLCEMVLSSGVKFMKKKDFEVLEEIWNYLIETSPIRMLNWWKVNGLFGGFGLNFKIV